MDHERVRNDEMLNRIFTTLLAECYKRDNSLNIEERFKMTPNEVVDALTEHYDDIFRANESGEPTIESRIDKLEKAVDEIRYKVNSINYSDAHFRW